MRFIRAKAVLAGVGLALSLTACGDAGDDDDSGTDVEVEENAADDFDDGTRMKELADAGKVMIGVKYDQPGLGFKGATDDLPSGFDVEIAKLLVADLGIDPEDTSVVTYEETISDNREPFLLQGKVDLVLASYSITDERRAEVGQTGPYFLTGQQLLVPTDSDVESIDDLAGQEVCSVTGSTSIDRINEQGAKGIGFDSYSECVQKVLDGTVPAMSTDGSILAGYAAAERGPAEGCGRRVLRGADRGRVQPRAPRDVRLDQRRPGGLLRGRELGGGVREDPRPVRHRDAGAAGVGRVPRGLGPVPAIR